VGGAARDFCMGLTPKDFDITTNALPDEIEKIFKKTLSVGKQFGVMVVCMGRDQFEIATFRKDIKYTDGRHPDEVIFTDAEEDVKRRDFTINGLLWNPKNNEVIDLVKGKQDLKNHLIRSIGDPTERFNEDKLRVFRAIRFAANLGFEIETHTWKALSDKNLDLTKISKERIRTEFEKIISRPHSLRGLQLLHRAGLLNFVLWEGFFEKSKPLPACLGHLLPDPIQFTVPNALTRIHLSSPHFLHLKEKPPSTEFCGSIQKKLKQLGHS